MYAFACGYHDAESTPRRPSSYFLAPPVQQVDIVLRAVARASDSAAGIWYTSTRRYVHLSLADGATFCEFEVLVHTIFVEEMFAR